MVDFECGRDGARRRRRHAIQLAVFAMVCVLAVMGCRRRQTIWAGAGFFPRDSGQLRLAAEQPMCGCLTLVNQTTRTILLRTTLHGAVVGGETLGGRQRLRFRFDWAGPRNDDYYLLEGLENGRRVDLRQAVGLAETPRWQSCSGSECEYGRLGMDVADTGR